MTKDLFKWWVAYIITSMRTRILYFFYFQVHYMLSVFTSGMKCQSIVYLSRGSDHLYWILGIQGKVHSIWDLWTSGLQECKGVFFNPGGMGNTVDRGQYIYNWWGCPRLLDPKHPSPHDGVITRLVGARPNGMSSSPNHGFMMCWLKFKSIFLI